jgi:hypothetical protein
LFGFTDSDHGAFGVIPVGGRVVVL